MYKRQLFILPTGRVALRSDHLFRHRLYKIIKCAFGEATRQLVENLALSPNEIAIVDMEAGIEHFGRGIDDSADVILMVIDPSFESLKLSRKIGELSASIGKPIRYVLNKVNRGDEEFMGMRNSCWRWWENRRLFSMRGVRLPWPG